MHDRLYFKLKRTIHQLCQECDRPLPKRDALKRLAQQGNWAFYPQEFSDAMSDRRGPMSDGMLHGIAEHLKVTKERIVEFTSEVPQHLSELDVFRKGLHHLLHLADIATGGFRPHVRSFIRDQQSLNQAIDDILLAVGADTDRSVTVALPISLHDSEAIEKLLSIAAGRMLIDNNSFRANVTSWWKANPNAILSAYSTNNTHCGASVLLPVQKSTYDALRRGEIRDIHIDGSDIRLHSRYFFLVALADRSFTLRQNPRHMTTPIAGCVFAQAAMATTDRDTKHIHVLSFAGTETNRKRQIDNGFRALGVNMSQTPYELMEFSPTNPNASVIARAIDISRPLLKCLRGKPTA
ncbi:MAG: hypothetical protein R3E01_22065 [Pirellulaceae bacterium]|nr:hypothetical protein [Planctomycetales bacterium]